MSWLVHRWLLLYGTISFVFIKGKICDEPLLEGIHRTFPNEVFSGSGGSNDYENARFNGSGWCPSRSGSFLSLDLQKEYHITRVVVMGDRDQTKRSVSYSLRYSHNKTLVDTSLAIQVKGNQNGYQASTTDVVIYNVRYIKIRSTENTDFCLRIELCGEVQTPAPVNDIKVTPSNTSAQVTLGNPAPETSSYITHYYIKLNKYYIKTIRRQEPRTAFSITGLTPFTKYTVRIFAGDGSLLWSSSRYKIFTTNTAVPSAPKSVAFTTRSKEQLTVFWSAPSRNSQNGELTGYRVCYSDKENSSNPSCSPKNAQAYYDIAQIRDLQPATKYFVTVAARTAAGYGPKSEEINKITNGERVNPVAKSYSSLYIKITKPATYIKEVMIIVQVAPKNRGVNKIWKSDLKQYRANTKDLYVTAYLKADVLPLTFVIGDGKEYNSEKENYFNQPLKQNSSYIAFLRFFESQDSYYSTRWSDIVKTMIKPPAPVNLKMISTGLKKYTISWTQPFLPEQTTVLKYHGNYSASQGISKTLSISAEMRSVTIDVEFEKQYTFDIQVETRAGTSNVTSKSWTSHSVPLKLSGKTDDGYTVILRKPKEEQKIKTVALVILQLQLESNKPPAPENLNAANSPPSDTKPDTVVFIAKQFNITEFQNETIEIFLRESKGNRRRKINAVDVYTLIPNTTYRIAQMNTDGFGNPFWSYWSDPFTFTKAPSGAPKSVAFIKRSKSKLTVSWSAPAQKLRNGQLTGYNVCYSDKSRSSNPSCSPTNAHSNTAQINNLRFATKYFFTVAARTTAGYGPKSMEISKITNGDPVDPVATPYSSLNITIIKPATYIKEVMIIVQVAPKNRTVEEIGNSDLKPYQANTKDPYVTAYLKADVLPLTFVIGDGKEYNSEKETYFNQFLEHNSNYIVFLRFFESQDSYYSTEWSSAVKTMVKPGLSGPPLNVAFNSRGKTSLQVSWKAPEENLQNVELTGYQVCFYTRDTTAECLVLTSTKVLSLTLNNLRPSTKYFVTVSASTKAGYGEKSLEVGKITSGEPVNPLTASDYTLSLNIPKPAEYIREVMVIVQLVTSSETPSENVKTRELKAYQTNTRDPYITAYLKSDALPLTFVIGDGKEYNSEKEKYFNQPLVHNSSYLMFLRFFESQDSYYSTEWSNSVKTMTKRPVEFLSDSETSEQSSENNNTRLDLIIPLVILALCLLLSLAVMVYQRRRFQNNSRKESHKLMTLRQADQTGRFDSTPKPPNSKKSMEVIELTAERVSYVNDDTVYETPDDVIESIERNEAESKHEITTEEEMSAYISLTDNKEPENFYQPLQTLGTSAHPHDTKGDDDQSAFNLNVSAV